jgi:hypothetical protein
MMAQTAGSHLRDAAVGLGGGHDGGMDLRASVARQMG